MLFLAISKNSIAPTAKGPEPPKPGLFQKCNCSIAKSLNPKDHALFQQKQIQLLDCKRSKTPEKHATPKKSNWPDCPKGLNPKTSMTCTHDVFLLFWFLECHVCAINPGVQSPHTQHSKLTCGETMSKSLVNSNTITRLLQNTSSCASWRPWPFMFVG